MAFAAPLIVPIEADRQPKITLFVLHYLQLLTTDLKLTKQIGEMQTYVLQQAARRQFPLRSSLCEGYTWLALSKVI